MTTKEKLKIIEEVLLKHGVFDIKTFDVRERTPFSEYFLVGSAPNPRALKAYKDTVSDELEEKGIEVRLVEGQPDTKWLIIDTHEVLIHIFLVSMREEVNLEALLELKKA